MVGIISECEFQEKYADLKRDRDICQEQLNAAHRRIAKMSQEV